MEDGEDTNTMMVMVMVMVNDFMIEERVKAEQKGRREGPSCS